MTPDNLESLTDEQLSEVFAREVAGWKQSRFVDGYWIDADGIPQPKNLRRFSTSADAVLPYLAGAEWASDYDGERYLVSRHRHFADGWPYGEAPTFPKAACLALIRASRAKKAGEERP